MNAQIGLFFLALSQGTVEKVGGAVDSLWSAFATPLIILMVVAVLGLLLRTASKRYVKVPPEKALIVYGGGKTRVVSGGAKLVVPFFEDFYMLDLRAIQFDVELKNVPNKDSVPVHVKTSVTAKISSRDDLLPIAAGVFGTSNMADVTAKVKGVIEGHVRLLIGQSDMETILRKRDEFNQKIQSEVAVELAKLGCEIVVLNIQEVDDPNGYIQALGKPKTAEVKAEAAIKEAEQNRRSTIDTTNAQREAERTRADNEALIAEANRDLETKRADYNAEIARRRATAEQAGPLSTAEARRAVVAAEVEVEKSRVTAEIDLQDKVKEKTKAELAATILVHADAEKQRVVTAAEGQAKARTTTAEAERTALEAEGDGQAKKTRLAGFAQAEVTEKVGAAEASAERARLIAHADGKKAELLAHAEGTERELLAQAKGMQELVNSFKDMDEDQRRFLVTKMVLEQMPNIAAALGEAGEKIMGQIAQAVTASLAQIDSVTLYDSSSNGDGALSRMAKVAPNAVFETLQQLKATNVLPVVAGLLEKAGVDLSSVFPGVTTQGNGKALLAENPEPVATVKKPAGKTGQHVSAEAVE